jgi:hypothetical protein
MVEQRLGCYARNSAKKRNFLFASKRVFTVAQQVAILKSPAHPHDDATMISQFLIRPLHQTRNAARKLKNLHFPAKGEFIVAQQTPHFQSPARPQDDATMISQFLIRPPMRTLSPKFSKLFCASRSPQ